MTSVSLNPPSPSFPLTDQIEDQNQLFISPNNLDSTNSLSSCRNFFNILDQTQMTRETGELRQDQEDDGLVLHGGSSNHHVFNSSFNSPQSQPFRDDRRNECGYKVEEEESKSGYESAKWMSSKMRLMRKMMIPNTTPVPHKVSPTFRTLEHQKTQRSLANHRNGTTTRVCANCNTTSTPLWRGGPMGPKSLCNACGIRQRKARRAMAEAANGVVNSKVNKEKKPRTNHFVQFKNKCRATSSAGTSQAERRNTGFKDFAFSFRNNISVVQQVFPPDEVAEAALLLMDLSCASIRI